MDVRVESRDEPNSAVTRVADAALTATERSCDEEGIKLEKAIVLLHVSGGDVGDDDSAVASSGIEDERELLDMILVHATAAAAACGIELTSVPMERNWG